MELDARPVGRRPLLAGGAALVGMSVLPAAVARAFAQARRAPTDDSPLDRAVQRARSRGKPVLVIVVPEPVEARRALVEFLGDLYWFAWDRLRYPFALVEVACATSKQLEPYVGPVADLVGLFELEELGARWSRVQGSVVSGVETLETSRDRARTAFLAALDGNLAMAERRAQTCVRALGPKRASEVEWALSEPDPLSVPTDLVDDGAATFHLAMRRDPANRRWTMALARAAGARVWGLAPEGARWCFEGGSSIRFLPDDAAAEREALAAQARELAPPPEPASASCGGGPCGTGTAGARGAQFLVFYTGDNG